VPEVRITAEPRTEFGKGGARRTRRAGKVPAVLYGHGADPRHISVPTREFEQALRAEGANVLLDLQLTDGSELALPKSIQRDPVRGDIEHIDLILVRRGERITVDIPIHITGDVVPGGLLEQVVTTLALSAEATNIPGGIEVDIAALGIGDSIHAREIALPDGVELTLDPEQTIVHILAAPTAEEMEAEPGGVTVDEVAEQAERAEAEGAEGAADEAPAAESETPAE
jgi:large subunit ribosomal protein L25